MNPSHENEFPHDGDFTSDNRNLFLFADKIFNLVDNFYLNEEKRIFIYEKEMPFIKDKFGKKKQSVSVFAYNNNVPGKHFNIPHFLRGIHIDLPRTDRKVEAFTKGYIIE